MLCNGSRPALIQRLPRHLRFQSSLAGRPESNSSLWASTSATKDLPKEKQVSRPRPGQQRKAVAPTNDGKNKNTQRGPIVGQQWKDVAPSKSRNRSTNGHSEWKDTHQSKVQEETRLKDLVQTLPTAVQSQEKQTFFEGSESADDSPLGETYLPSGSFVVTRRNNIETLGVVLGYYHKGSRKHFAMLSIAGDVWYPLPTDVTFVLPVYVPPNLSERCGLKEYPINDSELKARTEVLKRTRALVHELEAKYNGMGIFGAEIYPKVKSSDPNAWSEVTVADAARMVETSPRYQTIYATHRHLMNSSIHFVSRDPYLLTQTFDVRPQQDVDEIMKVLEWKRSNDPKLLMFAEKAKPIMAETAKRLRESALEPPSETPVAPAWSSDDMVIINFLKNSLRQKRSTQSDPFEIGLSAIMRLLDPSIPAVTEDSVVSVLTTLGVFAPWQDLVVIQKTLGIEAEPNSNSPRIIQQEERVKRTLASRPVTPSAPLGPDDFYPSDPLEIVRHDFGQMPVFVIDSADAKELDDGISIERIPSEPGSYWVHAHIANPTASLPPTHALAVDALKQGTAQYFIHHSVSLFPQSLIHHPSVGWSLGSQKGVPARVMTFSAKINSSGEIVDHQVRAGLVNNIRIISYDTANKILNCNPELTYISQPFGGPAKASSVGDLSAVPQSEKDDLHLLFRVSRAVQRHSQENKVTIGRWQAEVGFDEVPAGTMTPTLQYRHFRGFPEFRRYAVSSSEIFEVGAESMVAEIMKVAGRVGSTFALEHNLPLIRRAVEGPIYHSAEHEAALLALRTPSGHVWEWQALSHIAAINGAEYTLEPRQHFYVGAEEGKGYSRVTSPLRRALDLVSHWQFHKALLGKHADSSTPKFDRDWMDQFKVSFMVKEQVTSRHGNFHTSYWQAMFIKKWLNGELRGDGFIPANPEASYEGFLCDNGKRASMGLIEYKITVPSLAISGRLHGLGLDHPSGTKVLVKIKDVLLGVKPDISLDFVALA